MEKIREKFPDSDDLFSFLSHYGDMIYYDSLEKLAQSYARISAGFWIEGKSTDATRTGKEAWRIHEFIKAIIAEGS